MDSATDRAGDREDRNSTSGGVLQIGIHTLKTWSTTQQIIALSSGEAELYAMVKGCAHKQRACVRFCETLVLMLKHASAALGKAHRQGLGRTRHIDVQHLSILNEVADGTVHTRKVETTSNPAVVVFSFFSVCTDVCVTCTV